MAVKDLIKLTKEEREQLEAVARGKRGRLKIATWKVTRAKALLKIDRNKRGLAWTDAKVSEALDVTDDPSRTGKRPHSNAALWLSWNGNSERSLPPKSMVLLRHTSSGWPVPRHRKAVRSGARGWMFVEPLGGWRMVPVTSRRTAVDWAHRMKELVDHPRFADAEKITVVLDNLNTHDPGSLCEAFPPAEAKRIADELELVFTPKHGSWLTIAECQLSVLTRQSLSDRLESELTVQDRATPWAEERIEAQTGVDWPFTTDRARVYKPIEHSGRFSALTAT